ncbi:hypothetical protein PTSG_03628 [Salpingoeca rosetta]|uniref:Alpha/beta hydrolase fold-3 domain-containing protein n=1 Tax=Salpingoeca rosetta (strain ATCC 50818 / BSB-021) TaxID=946362 RepID=F2U651_SALR5|nr:uncharacterized protein PTSG_03628 [Salpingoeca rosetta]EGD82992.1 hypothetical protein PTSG_03628 [Salpingoeca rosetta]|eukprot:XP_004995356.1 hypothetical protein PTSG_03628 [Salpingoeca rosetta]
MHGSVLGGELDVGWSTVCHTAGSSTRLCLAHSPLPARQTGMEEPWKQWDQAEIDRQMSPSQWSHRLSADNVIKAHCAVLPTETDESRRLTEYKRDAYGDGAKGEVIDSYLPKDSTTPSIFSVSGLLDLAPVQASYANEALKLTDQQVARYSPLRLINQPHPNPTLHCQVVLAIAEHEPAEFRRHSEKYAQCLQAHSMPVELVDVPAVDHFDCIENLHQREYELTRRLIALASATRTSRRSSVSSNS